MVKFAMPQAVSSVLRRLPFVKRDKGGKHMRAHSRHPCVLIAEMQIPDKGIKLDGMVIEVSRGGIRFREASTYILDRRGTPVVIHLSGHEFPGSIVNVDTSGYGIKLDALIADDVVNSLVGGPNTGANAMRPNDSSGDPLSQPEAAAADEAGPAASNSEPTAAEGPQPT
ncbi:MAG TPA: PilZ domain-containing protein [Beijerinckiaceae bacterium]|nr:PilZ domain-containing protein [Beijerinckiaceae bacterium]